MPRNPKLEVAAINIRIPDPDKRDYNSLVRKLSEARVGVRVHGSVYLAISFYDAEERIGIFSKYTEIDLDSDWFDLEDFDTATPDRLREINIPENLRPNLAQFLFKLDEELHVIAFSSYIESRSVSARSVNKYFTDMVKRRNIVDEFGRIESDIIKSYGEVDRILSLPNLQELRLIIRRPNPDDVGNDLADVMERRLRDNDADEYEEVYRDKTHDGLTPTPRTKKVAQVAAENGRVKAKSYVNGVLTDQDTADIPLLEATTYEAGSGDIPVFKRLADKIFRSVREARARLRE